MRPKIWDKLSVNIDHVYRATMWVCVCKDEQPKHTQDNHICVCSSVVFNPQLFSNTSTVYIRRQWIWTYNIVVCAPQKFPWGEGLKGVISAHTRWWQVGYSPPPTSFVYGKKIGTIGLWSSRIPNVEWEESLS